MPYEQLVGSSYCCPKGCHGVYQGKCTGCQSLAMALPCVGQRTYADSLASLAHKAAMQEMNSSHVANGYSLFECSDFYSSLLMVMRAACKPAHKFPVHAGLKQGRTYRCLHQCRKDLRKEAEKMLLRDGEDGEVFFKQFISPHCSLLIKTVMKHQVRVSLYCFW